MLEHAHTIATIALAAFAVSVIGSWGVRFVQRRVGMASGDDQPTRTSPGAARPSPGPSPGADRAIGAVAPGSASGHFRVAMNAHAHVAEFVGWMRDHGFVGRYCSAEIGEYYLWWAHDTRVYPLPVAKFLEALGRPNTAVRKKRDRVKDKTGKVLKLASGSPQRAYYYTISEAPVMEGGTAAERLRKPATAPRAGARGVDARRVPERVHERAQGRVPPRATAAPGPDDVLAGFEVAA